MKQGITKQHASMAMTLIVGSGLLCNCSSASRNDNEGRAPSVSETAGSRSGGETMGDAVPSDEAPSGAAAPTEATTNPANGEGNPLPTSVAAPGEPGTIPGSDEPPVPTDPVSMPAPVPPFAGTFILGADISSVQEAVDGGTVYVDTDGQQKDMLALLKNHGFNYIRLRTFVNPGAQFGYASASGCRQKAEAYNDRDHTVEFAQAVKAAGMGFLLDFHYSDTWADPGKQVIPEAWRGAASIDALAEQVRAHTVDVLSALAAAGATPDMVQVGNEITPGMLIHVPTANTDCFGSDSVVNEGVNGSQANWDNLAMLLRSGIDGVRQVNSAIRVMLHIENTETPGAVIDWVQNAQARGVEFDVLGLSAYEEFQGPSDAWRATLSRLADALPNLSFAIAEYNPQRRLLNDIMHELPDGRGAGTFFWEPTLSGAWGNAMFTRQGNRLTANGNDFANYDQIRTDFGL